MNVSTRYSYTYEETGRTRKKEKNSHVHNGRYGVRRKRSVVRKKEWKHNWTRAQGEEQE
jgi:hypothetical protein